MFTQGLKDLPQKWVSAILSAFPMTTLAQAVGVKSLRRLSLPGPKFFLDTEIRFR